MIIIITNSIVDIPTITSSIGYTTIVNTSTIDCTTMDYTPTIGYTTTVNT